MSTARFIESYLGRKPKHGPKLVIGGEALPDYLRRLSIFTGGVDAVDPVNTDDDSIEESAGLDKYLQDDESDNESDNTEGLEEYLQNDNGLDEYLEDSADSAESSADPSEDSDEETDRVMVIGGVYQRLKSASTVEKDLLSLFHARAPAKRASTRQSAKHSARQSPKASTKRSRRSRKSPPNRSYKGLGDDAPADINEYLTEL